MIRIVSLGEDVALGLFAPWEVDEATSLIMNFLKHMTDGLFGDQKTNLKEAAGTVPQAIL